MEGTAAAVFTHAAVFVADFVLAFAAAGLFGLAIGLVVASVPGAPLDAGEVTDDAFAPVGDITRAAHGFAAESTQSQDKGFSYAAERLYRSSQTYDVFAAPPGSYGGSDRSASANHDLRGCSRRHVERGIRRTDPVFATRACGTPEFLR